MRSNRARDLLRAKPGESGSGNPDPTMQHPAASAETIKGENMPPRGGEDIAPAESERSPKASQEHAADDAPGDNGAA